jgi:hypothetical protein
METEIRQTPKDKLTKWGRLSAFNEGDDNLLGIVTQYFHDDNGNTERTQDKQHRWNKREHEQTHYTDDKQASH